MDPFVQKALWGAAYVLIVLWIAVSIVGLIGLARALWRLLTRLGL